MYHHHFTMGQYIFVNVAMLFTSNTQLAFVFSAGEAEKAKFAFLHFSDFNFTLDLF